jgi:hypothetical protein
MRSVVLTATLFTTLWLAAPARAAAQDPETAPPPSPPREVAVPRAERAERLRMREAEPTRTDAAAGEARRQPQTASAPATAMASEEQGAQRRGAVRRPPSGGSGGGGQARGGGESRGGSRGGDTADRGRSGNSNDGRDDTADGSNTRDRAVPRGSVPGPSRVYVYPRYYYDRYYDPWGYGAFGLGYSYREWGPWGPYFGSPGYYPYYGGGYPYYGGGYGYQYADYDTGSVKIKVKPRDAEVYVDNYFAGYVDDFDGVFQALKVETGGHRIELRKPGFETLQFDVHVQPSRSVTFRGEMKPVH